ncbi:hypothetical protein FHG87_015390 [Trinorchestia longiramus]|nr:hypothetical protein FHG87_015390 [Trinorchestia longiramus]
MSASKMLTLLLMLSVVYAHPYFPGHPRFYDEGHESGQPTVNVFKIYAPRLFYMPGYKPHFGRSESNFLEKSKQMITEPTERILDGIIRAEMFPDSLFEDDMEMQYDDEYVPEPSNIVSRKLPMYTSFRGPPMVADLEPSMNIDEYPSMMRNSRRDFMDDTPQFFPDYFDMHGENCNHHHHFQTDQREEEREEEAPVKEIERNFIKTILPDNTFVTTEVSSEKKVTEEDEETSESKDGDVPMEEVEVNIVKTILPDDSYLVSEAGGENEKFQDEVISMIQNSDVTATEGSKGSVFISRYLETPSVP